MKHARADYNERIQDTAGTIPPDEPVFLLRGQDALASRAVKFYAQLALENGVDPATVQAITRQAQAMHLWPHRKTPDVPTDTLENGQPADVSRETMTAAYASFHATLAGVVTDFIAFATDPKGYGEQFRIDLEPPEDEPVDTNAAQALMDALEAWAKDRHIDDRHASMDWKGKLFPGYRERPLDR